MSELKGLKVAEVHKVLQEQILLAQQVLKELKEIPEQMGLVHKVPKAQQGLKAQQG